MLTIPSIILHNMQCKGFRLVQSKLSGSWGIQHPKDGTYHSVSPKVAKPLSDHERIVEVESKGDLRRWEFRLQHGCPTDGCCETHIVPGKMSHWQEILDGSPKTIAAFPDIRCKCGVILRWTVPIFKTTDDGYVLKNITGSVQNPRFLSEGEKLQEKS